MVWNMFYLSIYWEFRHPNWRTPSFFRGVRLKPPTSLNELCSPVITGYRSRNIPQSPHILARFRWLICKGANLAAPAEDETWETTRTKHRGMDYPNLWIFSHLYHFISVKSITESYWISWTILLYIYIYIYIYIISPYLTISSLVSLAKGWFS